MLALQAASRGLVQRCHALALAQGARCARTTTRTITAPIFTTWTATRCACAAMARNGRGGCSDAVVRVSVRGVVDSEMDADRQADGEQLPGRAQRDAA